MYVNQILGQGSPHDYFYTNATVIVSGFFSYEPMSTRSITQIECPQAAYKNYVKTFVSRYVNEPGILVSPFPSLIEHTYRYMYSLSRVHRDGNWLMNLDVSVQRGPFLWCFQEL